ncbi:RabGAP/TBC [Dothidotthia symphoricarpi CBS 119687]|uniref:RabGAP/TBC n=1 Tax=Dothidotthia symphoricarpi CBS 119687 TaxID=1392245 RepID=A0A6A6AWL3_9PLEO|nr:RabGAP/TBC [Dothidotthia symphoricarpi CBS 119687]KAF2134911.1 RabGAP/TBC [Dothidotthia symphoricarpi CBS 119687]
MRDCAEAPSGAVPAPAPAAAPSSSSPAPRAWLTSARRPRTSPGPKRSALRGTLLSDDDTRRDSALTSSLCTANEPPSPHSLHKTPSLPAIVVHDDDLSPAPTRSSHASLDLGHGAAFTGLDTIIPTGSLDDLTSTSQVSFTKRGSMLLGGKKANRRSKHMGYGLASAPEPSTPPRSVGQAQPKDQDPDQQELTPPAPSHLTPRVPLHYSVRGRSTSGRVLSTDEMMLSRKVRTMYKHGNESAVDWDAPDEEASSGNTSGFDNCSTLNTPANTSSLAVDGNREDAKSFVSSRRGSVIVKTDAERAGGLEDWTDLQGNEVDRYGFIVPKKVRSKDTANGEGLDGPDEPRLQRVTTSLQLVAQEPRRRHIGRSVSRARSIRSLDPRTESSRRRASWKSARPSRSIFSNQTSGTHATQTSLRHAANKLPHNRERRMLDEASDMLKLPPGLAEVAEQREGGRAARAMRTKEIERDEKWRNMAKVVKLDAPIGGMLFEFDVKDPKVVSRTWKGIPDRWRSTAWYSFLAASAKNDPNSPSEEELIASFYELQAESSAEDVQIDVDVPRTINRHIMFRRRYRGGQRLLFRVLHAMSLYLPETGYVQGMAALAATLLCYYEEDRAFVMLVRLWMLRGLERLYESGFSGLTDALEDFEQNWLRGGDIAQKLEELDIHSTAWGTRWYLTLFNYSLPFPAQLRVWDVFMLLGDSSYSSSPTSKFSGDLDVLHATSAALIDATREILLDSDFENAMKVLTSWIPIKDEELLMRVAKAEYRMRKKRANA